MRSWTGPDSPPAEGVGDIRWLETGLRETSVRACRGLLEGLLSMPGLRIPGDQRRRGSDASETCRERSTPCSATIEVKRNWYKAAEAGPARFPLDETLRLIDGYTPALVG